MRLTRRKLLPLFCQTATYSGFSLWPVITDIALTATQTAQWAFSKKTGQGGLQ